MLLMWNTLRLACKSSSIPLVFVLCLLLKTRKTMFLCCLPLRVVAQMWVTSRVKEPSNLNLANWTPGASGWEPSSTNCSTLWDSIISNALQIEMSS